MTGLDEFLQMGGYGGYIWPAYGLTALVLVGFLASSLGGLRRRQRELEGIEAASPSRRRRHGGTREP